MYIFTCNQIDFANKSIERYKALWVVFSFFEDTDVHFGPMNTHALVVSDPSLLIVLSLTIMHNFHLKELDAKTAFLDFPLFHEV